MVLESPSPGPRARLAELVEGWVGRQLESASAVVAVDRDEGSGRWYVRMRGEEKTVITVWLTLGELTLAYETHFMPAPEENVLACYEYLLRKNAQLYGMRFALGAEDAVYLTGQMPLECVDEHELDRLMGSALEYVEQCFPTAMSLGYESRYRRRR